MAWLPTASLAEQLTVLEPSGKSEPDAGMHVTCAGPLMASFADAVKVTRAPVGPVASAIMFGGSANTGGVLSMLTTYVFGNSKFPARSSA